MAEIGLRYWDGSQAVEIPATDDLSGQKLRVVKNGTTYGIPLVDPSSPGALPIRINIGTVAVPDIKAIGTLGYYEINRLARSYTGYGEAPWHNLISGGALVDTDSYLIYSTTQGNWTPSPTNTETLRLNADGSVTASGKHPTVKFGIWYRVYESFKARVYVNGGGNGYPPQTSPSYRGSNNSTYQRQDSTTILVNGTPRTITIGGTYQVYSTTWYCGGYGTGHVTVVVRNVASNYFDVEVEVYENDEEYDNAGIIMDSYIEPAP